MPLKLRAATLRQLEVFLEVYQSGSLTQAAQRMHLSQPTVSIQLKRLSEALGVTLYHFRGRQLLFTESARLLAQCASEVLRCGERFEMALADLHQLKSGTLRIAVVTSAKYFVPHIIGPFCRQYPLIDIRLKIGNRAQIRQRLQQGLDDIYVFSQIPDHPPVHSRPLLDNPLVVVAASDDSLFQQSKLTLAKLASRPFLMRERDSGTRQAIERHLRAHNIELNVRMEIESNEAIKHCVAEGLGLSILSQHTLTLDPVPAIGVLPVDGLPIQTQWHTLWLADQALSVAAKAFLEYTENHPLVLPSAGWGSGEGVH
ncbi:LysR family transcriptional regulator [Ferrimonas aestuarii]|nr:LysR family transcriptional regulator [Ferrimonas aestuarii]